MKKVTYLVLLAVLAVFAMGCATAPEASEAPETSEIPDWFLMPPQAEDAMYGVGSANSSDVNIAIQKAETRALTNLSRQLETQVQNMVTQYTQEAGVDGNTQVVEFFEDITRQVSEQTLNGWARKNADYSSNGGSYTAFILVELPIGQAAAAVEEVFQRNEDAAFAEFKADQALEMLDAQLRNEPTDPQDFPTDEE